MCVDDQILSRKSCNLWIYRHSVINSTLCGQVIILRRGSHSVDKSKFCRYVHIILTSTYCILKIGPFPRIITWTFSAWKSGLRTFLAFSHVWCLVPQSIHLSSNMLKTIWNSAQYNSGTLFIKKQDILHTVSTKKGYMW